MLFIFNILDTFILLGAVQGLLLSATLWFSKSHQQRAYFLSIFLLILAYNGLETFGASVGTSNATLIFWVDVFSPMYFFFGLGASLYLYVSSFIKVEPISFKRIWKYYLPMFVQVFLRIALLFFAFFFQQMRDAIIALDSIHFEGTKLFNVIVFWIYFYFSFKKYQQFTKEESSLSPEEKQLISKWLRTFLLALFLTTVFWTANVLASFFVAEVNIYFYYPIEIILVLFIYWVGFASFHRTKIIYAIPQKTASTFLENIDQAAIEKCISLLQKAMESEKLFLDPELNVGKLAKHLQVSQKMLSAVLNQHLGKGFNEFVNEYRIKEVKEKLLSKDYEHFTITGIAFEAGFNSQATFQRVFKELTNFTPKEFLASENKHSNPDLGR